MHSGDSVEAKPDWDLTAQAEPDYQTRQTRASIGDRSNLCFRLAAGWPCAALHARGTATTQWTGFLGGELARQDFAAGMVRGFLRIKGLLQGAILGLMRLNFLFAPLVFAMLSLSWQEQKLTQKHNFAILLGIKGAFLLFRHPLLLHAVDPVQSRLSE